MRQKKNNEKIELNSLMTCLKPKRLIKGDEAVKKDLQSLYGKKKLRKKGKEKKREKADNCNKR